MTPESRPPQPGTTLASLSRKYRPALISFFLRRVRNHADAEDLTHDVLLRVATAGDTQDILRPDAYVFRTAANVLRDRFRRDFVRDTALSQALGTGPADAGIEPERILTGQESLATVLDALQELPPRTRSIFILYRLENMSRPEIAGLLGISVSAVEKHVMRATLHLHDRLNSDRLDGELHNSKDRE